MITETTRQLDSTAQGILLGGETAERARPGGWRLQRRKLLQAAAPVAVAAVAGPAFLAGTAQATTSTIDLAAFATTNGVSLASTGLIQGNPAAEALARRYGIALQTRPRNNRTAIYDGADTVQWLVLQTALLALAGPGEVLVPPGSYRTARHLRLPDGAGLRGTGTAPEQVVIDNVAVPESMLPGADSCSPDLSLGYDNYLRGMLFAIGTTQPTMMPGVGGVASSPDAIATAAISPALKGQGSVRLTAGSGLTLGVGQFVAIFDDARTEALEGKDFIERARLQITAITAISGDLLQLADPLYCDFNGQPRLAAFETGNDPLFNTPWRMTRDVSVTNLSGTGTSLVSRCGIYNGLFDRVKFNGLNGFTVNGIVNTVFKDCVFESRRKGVEIKGYSLNSRLERCRIAYVGTGKVYDCTAGSAANGYLLDLGQSSAKISFVDCDFVDNPSYPFDGLAEIAGYDTKVQGCTFAGRAADGFLVKIMPEIDPNTVTIEASARWRSAFVSAHPSVRRYLNVSYPSNGTTAGPQVTARQIDCSGPTATTDRYQVFLKGGAGAAGDIRFDEGGTFVVRRSKVLLGSTYSWT